MIYLFGKHLKSNAYTPVAITSIYGIGKKNSMTICNSLGISNFKKISQLTNTQIYNLRQLIKDNFVVSGDLKKQILTNIIRYIDIKCYRGFRHKHSYPVRGQRTHTNAQTQKKISKQRNIFQIEK